MKPLIYQYHDCLQFITDWFAWKKETAPHFSHRSFAMQAKLPSHNYVMRIINGTRNLSEAYIEPIARGMGLSTDETSYFKHLLLLNTETSSEKKTALFLSACAMRAEKKQFILADEQLRFHEKWYYPLIWEMAPLLSHPDDHAAIAAATIPPITKSEVKEAIAVLLSIGILELTAEGRYRRLSPVVSTGDEIANAVVRHYHRQHLRKSAEILDIIDPADRDISSVTIAASEESFRHMKKVIQNCRKELLRIAAEDRSPDRIYLSAFQLIPQSRPLGDV